MATSFWSLLSGEGESPLVVPVDKIRGISFGDCHVAAVTRDCDVYTWGVGDRGQLGHGEAEKEVEAPRRVATLDGQAVRQVCCGGEHTICITTSDVLAFGANDARQCAITGSPEAPTCLSKPKKVPFFVSLATPLLQVACGANHTLVLTTAGQVYGWGSASHGQLGLGVRGTDVAQPALLESLQALPVSQIACGAAHSVALLATGVVYTWGRNRYGQLGLGRPNVAASTALSAASSERVEAQRDAERARAVRRTLEPSYAAPVNLRWLSMLQEMGFPHVQAENALARTGSVHIDVAVEYLLNHAASTSMDDNGDAATPSGSQGTLSSYSTDDQLLPRCIPSLQGVVAIACGADHVVCCDDAGRAWSFGANRAGQLGIGTTQDAPFPNLIESFKGMRIVSIACGMVHSVFLTESGRVFGCGSAESGQLGSLLDVDGKVLKRAETPLALRSPPSSVLPSDAVAGAIVAGGHCTAIQWQCTPATLPSLVPLARTTTTAPLERLQDAVSRFATIAQSKLRDSSYEAVAARTAAASQVCSTIEVLFRSPSATTAAFLARPGGAQFDAARLADVYKSILELYEPVIVQSLYGSLRSMAETVRDRLIFLSKAPTPSITMEHALPLLALLQAPILTDARFASTLVPILGDMIARLPRDILASLAAQLARCPKEILGAYCVRPLHQLIRSEFETRGALSRTVMACCQLLTLLHHGSMLGPQPLRLDEFYSPELSQAIARQDAPWAHEMYNTWRIKYSGMKTAAQSTQMFSLCEFPVLLSPQAKARLLNAEANINMAHVVQQSRQENFSRVFGGMFGGGGSRDPLEQERVAPLRSKSGLTRASSSTSVGRTPRSTAAPTTATAGVGRRVVLPDGRTMRVMPGGGGAGGLFDGLFSLMFGMDGTALAGAEAPHDESLPTVSNDLPRPEACGVPPTHPDVCILRIRRTHLLEDALEEISRQRPRDLYKPLRVHMIGEEGVDGGGVRKEFFQLLMGALTRPEFGMFCHNAESRVLYLNPDSFEADVDFMLVGILVSLAIYNAVLLDLTLPLVIYKKLMGLETTLDDLAEMQPRVAQSLKQLLDYNENESGGSVEDVFCLTFSIDVEVFGQVRTVPLRPGGEDEVVTAANRHEYVAAYVDWVLNRSIERQYKAFERGFLTLCGGPVLRLITPRELEALVCGDPHLDFRQLRRVAKYEGGYSESSRAVVWLWEILEDMSLEERKKFLKFFSGSDRAPVGGLEALGITIQRAGSDCDRLPTSHTCFNTLLLHDYSSRGKMRHLLKIAIENAEGFGLR